MTSQSGPNSRQLDQLLVMDLTASKSPTLFFKLFAYPCLETFISTLCVLIQSGFLSFAALSQQTNFLIGTRCKYQLWESYQMLVL